MLAFIARRLLIAIPLLIVSSFLVFAMVANAGDPLEDLRYRNPPPPENVIQAAEERLNLDKPVIQRYGLWFAGIVRGDFGRDLDDQAVGPQVWRALQVTLRLVVVSIIVAVLLALIVGSVGALRQYSVFDYTSTFAAFLFFSLPVFWLAALLKEYAAVRLNKLIGSTWIYTVQDQSPDLTGGFWHRMGDYAGHLALPALTLVLISFAQYSRFTRSSMLDTLKSDYVRTAEAKGIPRRKVILRHALRNALIPVTTIVAIDFGAVLSGAVITERVFQWRGMGTLLVDGIVNFDPNIVLGWLMITALIVVIFNLMADIAYAYLDPRIRLG